MRNLLQDLRFGWRMLRKQPGFTLVAILTLALGIGANAAIFSIVNAVLLRPLPYAHPERLMSCYWQLGDEEIDAVTALVFDYWKNHSQSFDAAGYETVNSGFNLSGGAEAVRVRGLQVSEGFFRVLGASPASGRGFLPEEDRPKGPGAVIISDSLWRGYFSGDAALVGKVVQLNGRPYT